MKKTKRKQKKNKIHSNLFVGRGWFRCFYCGIYDLSVIFMWRYTNYLPSNDLIFQVPKIIGPNERKTWTNFLNI